MAVGEPHNQAFVRMIEWVRAQKDLADAQDCVYRAMHRMEILEEDSIVYEVTAVALAGLMDAERFCAERKEACHRLMQAGE